MRTTSYKEKARNYVLAARALGASDWRIITQHLLPNTRALLITFAPFSITGGITALTALDCPPPHQAGVFYCAKVCLDSTASG